MALGVFAILGVLVGWMLTGLGSAFQWPGRIKAFDHKSKRELVRSMGKPDFVLTPADVKRDGIDSPWRNENYYPVPTRPVRKQVLLYRNPHDYSSAAYVFVDAQDQVEAIDFAGT